MENDLKQLLKSSGFRATRARIQVLEFLSKKKKPVGIQVAAKALPNVNKVTLYRMMADFVEKGIVKEYELGHGHADYELATRPHHHHVVCESCGEIEDVFPCGDDCGFIDSVRESSKKFKQISRQSATFYGTCLSCFSR